MTDDNKTDGSIAALVQMQLTADSRHSPMQANPVRDECAATFLLPGGQGGRGQGLQGNLD